MAETSQETSIDDEISSLARAAGFDLAGIVSLADDDESFRSSYLENWIAAGRAGEMEYLKRREEDQQLLRCSIQTVFPWARSVVVCAANYNADAPRSIDEAPVGAGWIARYAWSGRAGENDASAQATDYHDVLLRRLRRVEGKLQARLQFEQSRSYVDTGPIIERSYAELAGIGWTGKNTCILNQELGSWLFLGVIVTSYELPHRDRERARVPDRCGTCRRCIEACPTDALVAPYEMDASRCIAYLTIEKRGTIAEPLRAQMGRQVFGCDICQDVCPWNRKAPFTADTELAARQGLVNPQLAWLASLDAISFKRWFKDSAVSRTKLAGLHRNVAIAMGNSGDTDCLMKLREWAESADPTLAETATWAILRIVELNRQEVGAQTERPS